METRTITETKIYIIVASHVKGAVDKYQAVLCSYDKQKLIDYIEKNREEWTDENGGIDYYGNEHSYSKSFKRGSKLEWFNEPEIVTEWVTDEHSINIEMI